ncbi:MAG: hypothetical protein JXB35_06320 [Anaerolineae bacterium]|nr:hypothetical protein [Anaerolineae bacterium]
MTTEIFPDIDSLIIGHVTRDLVSDGRGQVLGGTASYAATVSAVLGRRVGVLTSASADLDLGELTGVAGSVCIPAAHTTTFENRYGRAGREQILHARACEIGPPHVPRSWQHVSLVHIGPVCDECDPELVAFFHGRSFVGLTPQGWMRSVAVGKPVAAKPWLEAERLLPLASAVVLSI